MIPLGATWTSPPLRPTSLTQRERLLTPSPTLDPRPFHSGGQTVVYVGEREASLRLATANTAPDCGVSEIRVDCR